MKKLRNKKQTALLASLLTVCTSCAVAGGANLLKAYADETAVTAYTIEQVTAAETGSFSMLYGASVRSDSSDKVSNGLRYTLTLSEAHYEGLKESVKQGTYDSVSYGIFILPAEYNETYAVRDYAFGENVKYNWAVQNASGEWEYTAESGKVRIFNLPGTAMTYNAKYGVMAYYGAITNNLDENMGTEMLGVGYLAYTVDGVTNYVFTPVANEADNVRSMAYVAQAAIADGASNAEWLKDTYIKPVTTVNTTYEYVNEYYFENDEGEFVLDSSKTTKASAAIETEVSANVQEFDGYVYDETNVNNVKTAKVMAVNGATVLKSYYKKDALTVVNDETMQLVEVNAISSLNLVEMYGYDLSKCASVVAKLTAPNGRVVTPEDPENVNTADIPQGVYAVELTADDTVVYTANIDVYNEDDGMVWQEISEYSVNDSEVLRGGYLRLADTYVSTVGTTPVLSFDMVAGENSTTEVGMRLRALHSKEYYTLLSEVYPTITFDIYVKGNNGMNIEVWDDVDGDGKQGDTDGIWHTKNTWATYSVDINYLLANWEAINGVGQLKLGNTMQSQLFTTLYGYVDDNVISIGNFGSVCSFEAIVVEGTQLVETAATPTYNLLDLDSTNTLDKALPYKAVLTAPNGRVVKFADASAINTAGIPQGVYTAEVKLNGVTYLTATVDIYTATDGMVWQEITEYSVNDSEIMEYGYYVLANTNFATLDGENVLYFVVMNKKDGGNGSGVGMRIRAIHSKEYYVMMSEQYSAITFDIRLQTAGGNVNVYYDGDGDGVDDTGTAWQGVNAGWVTYTMHISYLLDNWNTMCVLGTVTGSALNSQLFTTQSGAIGSTVYNIGNFGCVAKTTTEA